MQRSCRFKTHCLAAGKPEQIALLKTISPTSWEHIILNGFYDLYETNENWDIESQFERLVIAA